MNVTSPCRPAPVRRARIAVATAAVTVAVALVGAGCTASTLGDSRGGATGAAPGSAGQSAGQPAPASAPQPGVSVAAASVSTARAQLTTLTIAEPRRGGYQRTKDFGAAWSYDSDHDGCRQRDDVLRRDMTKVKLKGRCTVLSGVLLDPYTGRTINFTRTDAAKVQIDHIYPLAAAWSHGARTWPAKRRLELANDLTNLLAASGTANQQKSDSTPAEWQPRAAERCDYAVRYIRVAATYRLSISSADRQALTSMLARCSK